MDDFKQIVQKLYDMTKSNEKVWSRTNLVSQYTVESGKGRINIVYNKPNNLYIGVNPPVYQLLILNDNNEIIERINANVPDQNDEMFVLMKKLWMEIEDKYYKRSETLDSIKADLGIG